MHILFFPVRIVRMSPPEQTRCDSDRNPNLISRPLLVLHDAAKLIIPVMPRQCRDELVPAASGGKRGMW